MTDDFSDRRHHTHFRRATDGRVGIDMAPPIPRQLALVVVLLLMGRIIAYTPTTATASPAASTRARASIRGAIPCT